MDSQKIQEIIISTIEDIAKNTILNTNYLTLINGQISNVDKFNNFYNFTYQKEEYTGFSITGETYEVGDLVYVLKLNNDLTSKQMIISKVNSYTNFNIEMAINESLEEIKESISQIEAQDKEISIIGNTVFTLNDDLTITPNELTFSAQKSGNITDIVWYVDGAEYIQDNLKKITIPNSLVENKDNIIVRVQDLNNEEVYDEITVIRAMSSDTKLELDLGLDSILLQKNEQGVIDYSKAILTPKVLSDGEDVTSNGWSFDYKIENGEITLIKEQDNYKITNMNSDKGKISFFAIKNGKMYLQRVIYLSIVTFGENNVNITVSNQNFVISKTNKDKVKDTVLSTTIRAIKGSKLLKIEPELTVPSIGSAPGSFIINDDNSVTYSWKLNENTELASTDGEVELSYAIEKEKYNTSILWTTVNDGASGAENRLVISPPNIMKNGDGTFSPNEITIKSLLNKNAEELPYNGYFKIYETTDNENYTLTYESKEEESVKTYIISNLDIKSLKIEFLNADKVLLITEYCYVNINSSDFIEVTKKTEKNETHLTKVDGQIQGLVKKDETIETTITNLETGTEQKFTEVNNKYSEVNQKVDSVTTTVSSHTEQLESVNGELVSQGERLSIAEQKITDDAIVSTVTKSESWKQISDDTNEALENSKSIKLNATSTAFSKAKGASAYIPSNITIAAELKSQTFGKYEYATGTNGTFKAVVNGQHGFTLSGSTLTISNSSDLFTNSNNAIIIKGSTSTNSATDKVTIIRISDGVDGKPGEDAYTAVLGNESISISCLNNGNTASAATFTIPVYSYLGSSLFACTISVGTLPTGITAQVTNGTSSANGKIILNIANNSNLGGTKNGTIQVNININGKVFTKQITWSKAIAGSDGSAGSTGRVYFLEPTTVIIKKGKDGKLNPSNVTFSSFYRDGSNATRTSYLGRFIIQESTDGSSYTTKYTSSTNEGSKVYTPTSTAKTIKCIMYAAGGTTTPLDIQTVAIIEDIDGIEIGGRNFLKNTNFEKPLSDKDYSVRESAYTLSIDNNGYNGTKCLKAVANIAGSAGKDIRMFMTAQNEINSDYIFSGFVKADKATELAVRFGYGGGKISTVQVGVEWKYFSVMVKSGSTSYRELLPYITTLTTVYFSLLKLEKGNVATNWTPAPEDIEEDLSAVEKRVTSAEQKLTSTQWSLWFTEVVNNSVATSTKFTMDKNGLHIKGGGIDISNNAGTKVFYADTNGNLVINNLTANNGIFNGKINAASGTIGGWVIANSYLNSSAHNSSLNVDFVTKIDANLGNISFTSSNSEYTTNIGIDGIHFETGWSEGDRWVYRDVVYGLNGITSTGNIAGEYFSLDGHGVEFGPPETSVGWANNGGVLKALGNGELSNIRRINGYSIGGGNTGYNNMIIPVIGSDGVMEVSRYIDFHTERSQDYEARLNAGNKLLEVITNDFYSMANLHIGAPGTDLCNLELHGGAGSYARNAYIFLNDTGYIAIGQGDNHVDSTGSRLYLEPASSPYDMFIRPRNNNATTLGTSSKRWYGIYTSRSVNVSSDRRVKEDFTDFDDRYIKLVEMLHPIIYKLKSDTLDKSKLGGFIAQDVEDAMLKCGINKKEFGICKYDKESDAYALIYDMFIPLIYHYVQTKQKEIDRNSRSINESISNMNDEYIRLYQELITLNSKLDAFINGNYQIREVIA